jgi:hypothetical protein
MILKACCWIQVNCLFIQEKLCGKISLESNARKCYTVTYEHERNRDSLVGTVAIRGLVWISGWDQLLVYAQQLSGWF